MPGILGLAILFVSVLMGGAVLTVARRWDGGELASFHFFSVLIGFVILFSVFTIGAKFWLTADEANADDLEEKTVSNISSDQNHLVVTTDDGGEVRLTNSQVDVTYDPERPDTVLVVHHVRSDTWRCDTYCYELVIAGGGGQ